MLNSAIIEVAIGLIFVFSLLSILVTQINNVIVAALNLRARRLKEQLDVMLSDPVIRAKTLSHPLIRMVDPVVSDVIAAQAEGTKAEVAVQITEQQKARVDYIPTESFVDVLVDVLTENTGTKLYEELEKVINDMPPTVEKSQFRQLLRQIQLSGTGLVELRNLIATLNDEEIKHKMLVALNLVDAALDKLKAENSDMIPLLLGVRQVSDKYLQAALTAVLNTASNLEEARQKIGEWFNGMMDRATDTYVKEMRRISIIISLLLSLVLNVDTMQLARVLWEDPALRTAVAVTAAANVNQMQQDVENQVNPTQSGQGSVEEVQEAVNEAQVTLETLLELRLPIGWVIEPIRTEVNPELALSVDRLDPRNLWKFWPPNNPDGWLELWLFKIAGIALTTIALSQGAPFWFDLLRKLTRSGSNNNG
jgi:hypothetical protein